MPSLPIWILEDDPRRAERILWSCTRWNVAACVFRRSTELIRALESLSTLPCVISLDHDLNLSVPASDCSCGMDVVDWLVRQPPFAEVVVHSSNDPAAAEMASRLGDAGWAVGRCVPADDLAWIDSTWVDDVARSLRRAVAAGDAGFLLTWDDALREFASGHAACLGIVLSDRTIELYPAAAVNDAKRRRFRCHADVVRYSSIDRNAIAGGFSIIVRDGEIVGINTQSSLNAADDEHLLPASWIDAIIEEIGLPRAGRFRRYV